MNTDSVMGNFYQMLAEFCYCRYVVASVVVVLSCDCCCKVWCEIALMKQSTVFAVDESVA